MSFKAIKLITASVLAMTLSASAFTNAYIFKNPETNHEILVIGLVHTLGNEQIDNIMNSFKKTMARKLIAQLQMLRKIHPHNTTMCFYENADLKTIESNSAIDITDVIVEIFYNYEKQNAKNIFGYDPRSPWSSHLAGCSLIENVPGITGKSIMKQCAYDSTIPTIKECITAMNEEKTMISSWHINDTLKKSLLQENDNLQNKLNTITIPNATLPHAFFEGKLGNALISYDYKLADLGYYAKVRDTKENIILIVGQSHANSIKDLLLKDGYKMSLATNYTTPPAGSSTTAYEIKNTTIKSCADVEKAMAQFLFKNKTICNTCNKPATEQTKLLSCGQCLQVNYCNKECQKIDWSQHKLTCHK
jgi:MYND finger.